MGSDDTRAAAIAAIRRETATAFDQLCYAHQGEWSKLGGLTIDRLKLREMATRIADLAIDKVAALSALDGDGDARLRELRHLRHLLQDACAIVRWRRDRKPWTPAWGAMEEDLLRDAAKEGCGEPEPEPEPEAQDGDEASMIQCQYDDPQWNVHATHAIDDLDSRLRKVERALGGAS